jgi:creatinine amidohydrolase
VIIPTASIEQHGHHLPVGVDSILGQAILTAMIGGLSPSASVLIAPPITYGKSNEHVGFPGTLSIDAKLLRRTLLEVSEQLGELGFQRIILFNTHGGNSAVLHYTAREIREDYGILTLVLRHGSKPELATDQETAWGMHADEWETSLMLACSPELVQMDQAVCEYPARLSDPGLLRPEKAPAVFAWLSSDLSKSGVLGDPRPATREKGQLWMEAAGTALRERLREETERRLLGKERQLSLPN